MRRHRRKRMLVYALMIPSTINLVLPIVWMLILSLRPTSVILNGVESVTSREFVIDNYVEIFTKYNVLRYFANSVIVTLIPAGLSVLIALLGAYSLVRFRFRGQRLCYLLPLFAQIVPAMQVIIPFYVFMLMLGIVNTYLAVSLAHIFLVLPFAVWMMAGYLSSIPQEMEEAAMVDGCSRIGAILRVVIPVALPGIAATFLVAFLSSWAEFLFGFILTSTDAMRLLSVAVYLFMPGGMGPSSWGVLFAMAVIFMAPTIIVFLALQTFFREGLSLGATAGR